MGRRTYLLPAVHTALPLLPQHVSRSQTHKATAAGDSSIQTKPSEALSHLWYCCVEFRDMRAVLSHSRFKCGTKNELIGLQGVKGHRDLTPVPL